MARRIHEPNTGITVTRVQSWYGAWRETMDPQGRRPTAWIRVA